MAAGEKLVPVPLLSKPGIKRDGTLYEGEHHTDGLWTRFDQGTPRKMGGIRMSSAVMHGPSRGMYLQAQGGDTTWLHNGWASGIERSQILESGMATGAPTNRTPAGFVASADNLWIMDALYNVGATNTAIIAVAPQSATNIASEVESIIYYGDIAGGAPLVPLAPASGPTTVSGFLFCVSPYLFVGGTGGYLTWCAPNAPTNFATASGGGGTAGARIAKTKLVAGIALRGGPGNSPAALIWSLDSLIRMSYTGGAAVFDFDVISPDITILSQKGIIANDGVYFWMGLDRFYAFNGVVRELPNELNRNWFFDNLNYDHAEKSFALRNPRWGEIWFCAPMFGATECSHAAIYNYRYDIWYDTLLPNGGRTSGQLAQILRYPMMMSAVAESSGLYRLWQHEYLVDQWVDGSATAIRAYYDTADFAFPAGSVPGLPPADTHLDSQRIEVDMTLSGAIIITPKTKTYPMAETVDGTVMTFDPANFDATNPATYAQFQRQQGRIVRFRFESNVLGGNFVQGNTKMFLRHGDVRQT